MFEILFFIGLLEEGEDFTEFRNRVVELIKDVVFIVGSANVFKHMFAFLATCHQNNSWESSEAALFIMVSHGLLNRWTDIFFLPRTSWGPAFNPNNAAQTHSIFVKL